MSLKIQLYIFLIATIVGCKSNVPVPVPPQETDYSTCLVATSSTSLEIMTWNLEQYPLSFLTLDEVKNVISNLNPDVIALQEITSSAVFEDLKANLTGWDGAIAVSGNLNLAFLYKTSEITVNEKLVQLFTENSYAFPRPPAIIKLEHDLGQVYLIDVHLKCCDGTDNITRRKEAAVILKAYIDDNLPNERVVVLGDFNDEIYSEDGSEDTFKNFIDDPDNYQFEDMPIAMGDPSNWSYPNWPSHIDHLLVTNEFFNNQISIETLKLDACNDDYLIRVSDHRPVLMSIK